MLEDQESQKIFAFCDAHYKIIFKELLNENHNQDDAQNGWECLAKEFYGTDEGKIFIFEQNWKKQKKLTQKRQYLKSKLVSLQDQIFNSKKFRQKPIYQMIKQTSEKIKQLTESQKKIQNFNNFQLQPMRRRFKQEFLHNQMFLAEMNESIKGLEQQQIKFEKLNSQQISSTHEMQSTSQTKNNQKNIEQNFQIVESKQFYIQKLHQNQIIQKEWCYALAISNDNSLVVASCNETIKVFQLIEQKLKEAQLLKGHTDVVKLLKFMNLNMKFLSLSQDNIICIWQKNNNLDWESNQIFDCFFDQILSVQLNPLDGLLIIATQKTIDFWRQAKRQFEFSHYICVFGKLEMFCINEQSNILVVQVESSFVVYQKFDNNWDFVQEIIHKKSVQQMIFIDNYSFAYQSFFGDLYMYRSINLDEKEQQLIKGSQTKLKFVKVKKINIDVPQFSASIFTLKFVTQNYLNILKRQINDEYFLNQIKDSSDFYKCEEISQDGQYLISWDNRTKQYIVRQLGVF